MKYRGLKNHPFFNGLLVRKSILTQTREKDIPAEAEQQPRTLKELLALPSDQIEKVDIGLMNLLCAKGLPGAEDLNVEQCLKTLDKCLTPFPS